MTENCSSLESTAESRGLSGAMVSSMIHGWQRTSWAVTLSFGSLPNIFLSRSLALSEILGHGSDSKSNLAQKASPVLTVLVRVHQQKKNWNSQIKGITTTVIIRGMMMKKDRITLHPELALIHHHPQFTLSTINLKNLLQQTQQVRTPSPMQVSSTSTRTQPRFDHFHLLCK
ncbi:Os02g0831900 [Prunus dulcis]|uniref:Os02g0831900 n=1 Tax=Prunus dulcis TaxID=3755 RepID=A0A5E4ETB6_PRUDU|nr:hypothetical protein L3X38_023113 [Prunus dulcis]VVA19007.1 Os02g0831900 [Prunus dulcis]